MIQPSLDWQIPQKPRLTDRSLYTVDVIGCYGQAVVAEIFGRKVRRHQRTRHGEEVYFEQSRARVRAHAAEWRAFPAHEGDAARANWPWIAEQLIAEGLL